MFRSYRFGLNQGPNMANVSAAAHDNDNLHSIVTDFASLRAFWIAFGSAAN